MSRLAMAMAAVAGAVGAAAWLLLDPADEDKQRKQQQQQPHPRRRSLQGAAAPVAVRESSLQLRGSTASASSKVLLTGGYLILEPEFSGLVLALDARFRTALLALTPAAARQLQLAPRTTNSAPILVYAPQRCDTPARYELSWVPSEVADATGAGSGGWKLRAAAAGQEKNKFVEQSIVYTLEFLSSTMSPAELDRRIGDGWVLYLEGDYQFYSANKPERQEGSCVPPVVPDGSKTGLGSSAALVSSVVAAIFKHFGAFDAAQASASAAASSSAAASAVPSASTPFLSLPLASRLSIAHNLAQLIHCSAQGKVGSGFDVSTAFHGSQVYRRFTPQVLTECLALSSVGAAAAPDTTAASIPRSLLVSQLYDSDPVRGWNYSVQPFRLPPGIVVVLGDVAGGASTPVMVKKVLEWRASNKAASDALWADLSAANSGVRELLAELSAYAAQHELEYKSVRLVLAKTPASKWDQQPSGALPAGKIFCRLYTQFYRVRHLLRAMGEAAGIDIEPASSQSLLDTTLQSRGVLLAGVPGAGGDDAIFALVMDQEAVAPLEARWADFAFPGQPDRKVQRLPVSDEKDTIRFDEASIDVGQWNLLQQ